MDGIKSFLPQILFAVVLIGCACFAYSEYSSSETEPPELAQLVPDVKKVNEALNDKRVSPAYPYGSDAKATLKYDKQLGDNLKRTVKIEPDSLTYISYPRPEKPVVDAPSLIPHEDVDSKVSNLSDVQTKTDHGVALIVFKLPTDLVNTEVVRVQVFRSDVSAEKIDLTKPPYDTVELAAEDVIVESDKPVEAKSETPGEDTKEVLTPGEIRRRRKAEEETAPVPAGRPKPAKKEMVAPPEFADFKAYRDTHVEPKKTYFYKLRLIAKMKQTEPITLKNTAGEAIKVTEFRAPKDVEVVPSSPGSTVILYAEPASKAVSATPPANFEIRLAGTTGSIDPPGTPEFKRSKEYKGNFAVRVWVIDTQEWQQITIQAAPDERLKGTLDYRNPEKPKEKLSLDFDARYKLIEIKWGTISHDEATEMVPKLDKEGNPVLDAKTGKPIMEEKKKQSELIPNEVAVLQDVDSGKLEEFEKRGDFKARESSVDWFGARAIEQEKKNKEMKEQMEKVKARVKQADADRKAKAAAAAAAAAAASAAESAGSGNGGGSKGGGGGSSSSAGRGGGSSAGGGRGR